MTSDEIISMAATAGFADTQPENHSFLVGSAELREAHEQFLVMLERFAALVAEREREECAKLCDAISIDRRARAEAEEEDPDESGFWSGEACGAEDCAEAIRNRSRG